MAHEIDFTTGTAAMAYTSETPWHGLGQAANRAATQLEAAELAANEPAAPAEAEHTLEATTPPACLPVGMAGATTGEPGAATPKRLGLVSAAI